MDTPTPGAPTRAARSSRAVQDDDVVAVRYEECVARDLAGWCDGQVVSTEALDGTLTTSVYVPTVKGPRPALPGDWIVRDPEGTFRTCSAEEFIARYEPEEPSSVTD